MRHIAVDGPFAVFSDVHGNLPALEAVLADIAARNLRAAVCLGDLVGYGPWPNEVALLIRERGIPTVMGNYDQGIGFASGDCGCVYRTDEQRAEGAASLKWTTQVVSDEVRTHLRSLDDALVLETPGGQLLAVHGSPRRINEYLFADRPQSAMERLARQFPYAAILCGHTHVPYVRRAADTLFVNDGSAGRPKDDDWRACYAVVDPATLDSSGGVTFVRVPYDFPRLLAGLAAAPLLTSYVAPPDAVAETPSS